MLSTLKSKHCKILLATEEIDSRVKPTARKALGSTIKWPIPFDVK